MQKAIKTLALCRSNGFQFPRPGEKQDFGKPKEMDSSESNKDGSKTDTPTGPKTPKNSPPF